LIKRQTALGFGAVAGHESYEAMRDKILGESKRLFKPEFLNRLDDMIVFHQLERNDLVKIVDLEVAKIIERVRAKDINVHLDPSAVELLIDKGYDPTYGARRCVVLWRNTWRIPWPRNSCEVTSSRATRWTCTQLVNNWRSSWLEPEQGET
jgi:ATP-dependent Clp protease ATP-binding subunit ClpA